MLEGVENDCSIEECYIMITDIKSKSFICRERLGWVPELKEVPRNIAAHYGWIYDFSLLEMEVLHAAYRYCSANGMV